MASEHKQILKSARELRNKLSGLNKGILGVGELDFALDSLIEHYDAGADIRYSHHIAIARLLFYPYGKCASWLGEDTAHAIAEFQRDFSDALNKKMQSINTSNPSGSLCWDASCVAAGIEYPEDKMYSRRDLYNLFREFSMNPDTLLQSAGDATYEALLAVANGSLDLPEWDLSEESKLAINHFYIKHNARIDEIESRLAVRPDGAAYQKLKDEAWGIGIKASVACDELGISRSTDDIINSRLGKKTTKPTDLEISLKNVKNVFQEISRQIDLSQNQIYRLVSAAKNALPEFPDELKQLLQDFLEDNSAVIAFELGSDYNLLMAAQNNVNQINNVANNR